jgi:hypothetical protein
MKEIAILSLLKIQSGPLGNLREQPTKPYNADEKFVTIYDVIISMLATGSVKSV